MRLLEGTSKEDTGEMQGRTENNRVVNFDGGPNGRRLVCQLIDVHILQTYSYSLRGEVVVAP